MCVCVYVCVCVCCVCVVIVCVCVCVCVFVVIGTRMRNGRMRKRIGGRFAKLNRALVVPLEVDGHTWKDLVKPGHVSMHLRAAGFAQDKCLLMQFLWDSANLGGPVQVGAWGYEM